MDALIDDLAREAGLARTHVAFASLMASYKLAGGTTITPSNAPAVRAAALAALRSQTPSDRAVAMQAHFYASYTASRRAMEHRLADRRRRTGAVEDDLDALAAAVAAAGEGRELGQLARVYKHALEYCSAACASDPALSGMRPSARSNADLVEYMTAVSKESAAALESVLPRPALQPFLMQLSREERGAQLEEIAHLVAGIRLFNWEAGRGGPGMERTPSLAQAETRTLASDARDNLDKTLSLCAQYMDVLGAAHSGARPAGPGEDLGRWAAELANRRSLCGPLAAVAEDAASLASRAAAAAEEYAAELSALRRAMGESASSGAPVSKEAVYPRFIGMARAWFAAAEARVEGAELLAVSAAVAAFAPRSTVSTLPFSAIIEVQRASPAGPNGAGRAAVAFAPVEAPAPEEVRAERIDPRAGAASGDVALAGHCPVSLSTPVGVGAGSSAAAGAAEAPLGVLQPGDSAHGLYRYAGRLYAVSSARAGAAFAAAPSRYVGAAVSHALAHPALVHTLDLVDSFPLASLPLLASFDGNVGATAAAAAELAAAAAPAAAKGGGEDGAGGAAALGATGGGHGSGSGVGGASDLSRTARLGSTGRTSKRGAALVDVGVETPTHFVERHIDPSYNFSEWALRRQALRIANIRKCSTHGAQTDASAFRRDNDSQVYLPRESGTQTGISVGSNTDREVRYVTGVRGVHEPFVAAAAANKAAGRAALGALGSASVPVPGPAKAMVIIKATLEV